MEMFGYSWEMTGHVVQMAGQMQAQAETQRMEAQAQREEARQREEAQRMEAQAQRADAKQREELLIRMKTDADKTNAERKRVIAENDWPCSADGRPDAGPGGSPADGGPGLACRS